VRQESVEAVFSSAPDDAVVVHATLEVLEIRRRERAGHELAVVSGEPERVVHDLGRRERRPECSVNSAT
jgi:hypothetical protein